MNYKKEAQQIQSIIHNDYNGFLDEQEQIQEYLQERFNIDSELLFFQTWMIRYKKDVNSPNLVKEYLEK